MPARAVLVRVDGQDATKPAFESAKRNVEGLGESVKGLLNPLELLKGAIAGLGLLAVADFLKDSVKAAADNEAAWGRIAVAVNNAGIAFNGVEADLKSTLATIADGTRYSETEVSSAFGTLLSLTKNYQGSLDNLSVVTNLAAALQIDLKTSAELVGRVMTGNTQMLARYGITVKQGADAMEVLRAQFSGFAEKDGQTLQGKLAQISNAWEDFKIALGEALTNTNNEADAADKLLGALKSITKWIDDNKGGWQDFEDRLGRIADRFTQIKNLITSNVSTSPTAFGALVRFIMRGDAQIQGELAAVGADAAKNDIVGQNRAAKAGRQADDPFAEHGEIVAAEQVAANDAAAKEAARYEALEKEIPTLLEQAALLEKQRQSLTLTAAGYVQLDSLERRLGALAKDTNIPLQQRTAIQEKLTALAATDRSITAARLADEQKLAVAMRRNPLGDLTNPNTVRTTDGSQITVRASAAPLPPNERDTFSGRMHQGDVQARDALGLKDVDTSFDDLAQTIGRFRTTTLVGFFDDWQEGIQDVISGHESLGKAVASTARKAVGQAMAAEGRATMLKAEAAAIEGFFHPGMLIHAAELMGVGTAELAFAASLGGGGGGSSGGGGLSAAGFQQQQNQIGGQGKVTVVLHGKALSFTDPDQLANLKDALQELAGTRDLEFLVEG